MDNLEKFNNLVNDYGLDENETYIDNKGNTWFTRDFLAKLMGVEPSTISRNIQEIFDWEILDSDSHFKKFKNCTKKSTEARGRKKHYYSLDVLTQLGMTLRSENARNFQKQLRFIVKGLVNGDLKLTSTKSLFSCIANKPTTPYREKMIQKQLNSGRSENYVGVRVYNVKLNTAMRKVISKNKLSGHIPEVLIELGKIAYEMTPSEFREVNGITNPHITREFCTHEQNRLIQFLEEELCKMLFDHEGTLTKRQLFKYVEDCSERGAIYSKFLKDRNSLHSSPITATKQKSLEECL